MHAKCLLLAALLMVVACTHTQAFLLPSSAPRRSSTRRVTMMKATTTNNNNREVESRGNFLSKGLMGGLSALSLATIAGGAAQPAAAAGVKRLKNAPVVKLDNGVQYQDMAVGKGVTPSLGDRVAVHYSLYYNGLEIESSRDSSGLAARPYGFNWGTEKGTGSICKGVQLGMEGMQVGGRRKITVPPALAFGKKGLPPFIPPDATVLFDVSIWSIKPAGVNPNLTLPGQQNYF